MQRRHGALLAIPVAVAIAATGCSSSSKQASASQTSPTPPPQASSAAAPEHPSELVATVGKNNAFDIAIADQSGKELTTVAAGSYKLVVHDLSGIHDFHLTGPGVDVATAVGFVGDRTFTVTLKPGTYDFVCDIHRSSMAGSFTVS